MRLTDELYWTNNYKAHVFGEMHGGALVNFLQDQVTQVENKSSIEIGSFPGSYLPVIGRKGYKLHGVDFNPNNEKDLPAWLQSLNLNVGKFWTDDFFNFINQVDQQFDLVCSFGFVEHFLNYEEVILAHTRLLKPGGTIVITTPNFKGWMQYIPRKIFDSKNLKKHNMRSMRPSKWKSLLESQGFEIQFSGYFGKYYFWVDDAQPRSKVARFFLKNTNRIIFNLNKLIRFSGKESGSYSAFCGIVATRPTS